MKKTLMTCLAIAALFAIAGSASAITCTIDQRPAATLLVPYFQASFNQDGTPLGTGTNSLDTLVTICNASSAPMIAHVNVFNERTELVLDFNIALTGFDCQSMSMASVLSGHLPATPIDTDHDTVGDDACQRNSDAEIYPDSAGFLRIRPAQADTATPLDNTLATTLYPDPAWGAGSAFAEAVLDSLDETDDSVACGGVDGITINPIRGYLVIDHANYCNLSNPSDPNYYSRDAIGMENNLFGEVIFTSGGGIPTMGGSTVNIEADASLTGDVDTDIRTFYHRYVGTDGLCFGGNCAKFATNPWNQGIGDQREPLGLRYAARWFDTDGIGSFFNVWRASSGSLTDLLGDDCTDIEPVVSLTFFDEDENTVTSGVCPSPCQQQEFNFELETQRRPIGDFTHPSWPAGWVSMDFFNSGAPNGGVFDQAWVEYDIQGPTAFLSASTPATQLDPTNCVPLGIDPASVVDPGPVIPTIVGTGP